MATYKLYTATFRSMPIFHEALYIEFSPGKGQLYQVRRGHGPGWTYDTNDRSKIEDDPQFYRKYVRGTMAAADLARVDQICRGIPMPRNQVVQGITLYRDCRHWVIAALEKLEEQGILKAGK